MEIREHPVIDTNFLLASNEINRICKIAMDKIFMRRTGVIFYGPSRLGKTGCSCVLQDCLSKYSPKVYCNRVVVVNREGQKYTNIGLQLATLEGYQKKSRDTRWDVLNYLTDRIIVRVREHGCNQYVCIIDEFQRLKGGDLYQLVDLYNLLDQESVKMTVVSFAMPEVVDLREELFGIEQRQIISRLMSELIEFKGCSDVKDLAVILRGYDLQTEYPEGSGISFTCSFFPTAFASGFRLESYCELMWMCMNSYASGVYVKNLPMEHILATLRYLLNSYSENDSEDFKLSESMVCEAIEASSFKDFCKVSGRRGGE
ncbi:MAG: hypothetical protein LBJ33_24320 [Pseudomonas putida]|jgi:type II secretory pathway predicted ATPase ExeA|nr:hypothetical protein [Pseudomonas putida]